MAQSRTIGGVGLDIDGLDEAVKALRRLDRAYGKEITGVMRKVATDVQKRSQGRIGNHPGYRGPKTKGMIGRFATSKHAGVKLRAVKYPWALKAEFGEKVTHVYGRARRQTSLSRRTAPPFKPPTSSDMSKNKGGYMIQPTIRKRFPWITRELQDGITDLINDVMRKQGVRSRG